MDQKERHFAFVVPRYGREIGGGAETLVGSLAKHLARQGAKITVLTTCARDNRHWENVYPAGEFWEDGIQLLRFPVDDRNLERWVPLLIRLSEGLPLTLDEQFEWMQHSVNSAALYEHIATVGNIYSVLFFAPYLFGTTFHGALIRPERSVLIPCLHDESYAYVDLIGSMFRQVRGALFNTAPEKALAERLYGPVRGGEVGMGFVGYAEDELAALTPYFREEFPYLLYVGRKEGGKGVPLLIDYFLEYKTQNPNSRLCLVIAGGGSFDDLYRPYAREREDIIDLEQVTEEEKRRLIRHALFLCQPSLNESFSIVLMEAWLLGVPVVVNAGCAVTRHHVQESGAGLYFADVADFIGIVKRFVEDVELRHACAEAGQRYVRDRYNWEAIMARFTRALEVIGV